MICATCGREMPDTDRYCGICGALNPLLENAVPSHENADIPPTGDILAHEHPDISEEDLPVQDFAAGIQSSVTRVQGYAPYTQPNGAPAPEYRPFDPNAVQPPQKVKRTCSLSVVVFCGVVIFLLSVACGVLAGLYLSERAAHAPYSITEHDRR